MSDHHQVWCQSQCSCASGAVEDLAIAQEGRRQLEVDVERYVGQIAALQTELTAIKENRDWWVDACNEAWRQRDENSEFYKIDRADMKERYATIALEQRCERDTAWDRACTTIADKIRTSKG